jgi:eukaryotic-like serine/threonine-protein kinase
MSDRKQREGQRLGNYRLIQLLGQGNCASVYLGQHIHLNTLAAIKVLHEHLANHDMTDFLNEARVIARLRHPHIVQVLDFGIEGTTPFLVMDYAPGGNLRRRHPKGTQLPLDTVVSYVTQVAGALQYAHQEKLIHRDVKPENMLLGRNNEVLLSDFGIAIIVQTSRSQHTRDAVGSIAYMAPEQIQAHPSPASDQYALGIVVYEWLSGDRPFQGSLTEIAIKHALTPPLSLYEKVPTIPAAVEHVVLKALAKDPKERFASVQAFAGALEEAYKTESSGQTLSVLVSDPSREHPA